MQSQNGKTAAWLAWAVCALVVLLAILSLVLILADQAGRPVTATALVNAFSGLLAIPFALVAALIIARQPRNVIGWLLLVPAVMASVDPFTIRSVSGFPTAPPVLSLPLIVLIWYTSWSWLLLVFPIVLIPLYFPTGRPPSPRWRFVGIGMPVLAVIFILITTFSTEFQSASDVVSWSLPNPIGFLSESVAESVISVWIFGLISLTLFSVASLFVRYRRASAVERTQIRWLLYACGVFAVVYVSGFALPTGMLDAGQTAPSFVWNLAFNLVLLSIPAAIAIAILRYRLWDIDVIIRRTLVYSVLTAILALVYFGGVLILQPLVTRLTGQSTQLTTVLFTLMIAALFTPARRWVQSAIDRRFYRRKYDAAHTLAQFAAHARDETDLERLSARLGRAVEQTMEPEHVGLWLKSPKRDRGQS